MDHDTHDLLDYAQHLWPILSGLALTLVAIIRLWWVHHTHQQKWKVSINGQLAETVTREELHSCKTGVMDKAASVDQEILKEIKAIRTDMREDNRINAREHADILENATHSQQELMTQIIALHNRTHP